MINAKKTIIILLSFLCLTLIYSSCNIEPKETPIATPKVDKVLTDTIMPLLAARYSFVAKSYGCHCWYAGLAR